jgi:hypothetical protein
VALQYFKDLGRLTYRRFLEVFRLLGRVISPSQGLYLHRTIQHRKTRDKHPCFKRDSNPRSQQPTGQNPRLSTATVTGTHTHICMCERVKSQITTSELIDFKLMELTSLKELHSKEYIHFLRSGIGVIITNSMEQSMSWEADSHSAVNKFPTSYGTRKARHRSLS